MKKPLWAYQSLDEDGIIREVNQAWLDILGYSRQEVIGQLVRGFSPAGLTCTRIPGALPASMIPGRCAM